MRPVRSERGCERSDLAVQGATVGTVDDSFDELHPNGWLRQKLGEIIGRVHSAITDSRGSRQGFESKTLRRPEESLEGPHMGWFALLQCCEEAATVIVGHHEPEIRPLLQLPFDESGHVM